MSPNLVVRALTVLVPQLEADEGILGCLVQGGEESVPLFMRRL